VYPSEVESVLLRHPQVAMAAVFGLPAEIIGEEIAACVVRRPGAAVSEGEFTAWARENLPPTMYPRKVFFVDALPLGLSGKILKNELRARFITNA
jgi:long-chain acyl-CoA synthetase